jgi:HAD superfamily hydrolase (TIGR01549 family)
VFDRLSLDATPQEIHRHRQALWTILGPACFGIFPEVLETLQALKALGYPLVLISNWQRGVRHYCMELGLAPFFDHILGSADLGVAKPDPRIFDEAATRLGVSADCILHVGDTYDDDYWGAAAAGFQTCLIDRRPEPESPVDNVIRGLGELPSLLGRLS